MLPAKTQKESSTKQGNRQYPTWHMQKGRLKTGFFLFFDDLSLSYNRLQQNTYIVDGELKI